MIALPHNQTLCESLTYKGHTVLERKALHSSQSCSLWRQQLKISLSQWQQKLQPSANGSEWANNGCHYMWLYCCTTKESSWKKSKFLLPEILYVIICFADSYTLSYVYSNAESVVLRFSSRLRYPVPPTGYMLMNASARVRPSQTSVIDETFIKHIKKYNFSPGFWAWQVLKTQGVPIIPAWFNLLSKKQIQQPLIFKDDREQPLRQPNASFCITRLLQRRADGWSSLCIPTIEAAQLC